MSRAQRPAQPATAQGLASREKILAAAMELFAERGYAATSVDALCRRAATTPTALYWHFGSKEGLLTAALDRAAGVWIETILKSVDLSGDPLLRLDRAMDGMRTLVEQHSNLLRLILTVLLERADSDAEARSVLERIFGRARAAVATSIELAVGPVKDAPLVAHVALALLEGAVIRALTEPRDSDLGEIMRISRRALGLLIGDRAAAAGTPPLAEATGRIRRQRAPGADDKM
jgi:AcrR family transcriptional regulator